ncbi:MAG: hypothetical protein M0Z50_13860 [Planctomycetia bacterium]|nr:hypothetical protein [Planctomycetia bacterium]
MDVIRLKINGRFESVDQVFWWLVLKRPTTPQAEFVKGHENRF